MNKIKLLLLTALVALLTGINTRAELPALTIDYSMVSLPEEFNGANSGGYIDLDNNGTPDFLITFSDYDSGYSSSRILGMGSLLSPSLGKKISEGNKIVSERPLDTPPTSSGLQDIPLYFTSVLSAGELISEDADEWFFSSYFFRNTPPTSPAPLGGTFYDGDYEGYLGVYFLGDDNEFHYGWLSVELGPNGEYVKINGSAYNPSPGQPIIAGASATPVPVPLIASILGFGLIGGGILLKRRKRNK